MVWKFVSIVLLTMLKFIAGPTLGYAGGFSLVTTISMTVIGMMLSVVLFTFLGSVLKKKILDRIFVKRRKFTARNRRVIRVWRKYGLNCVAFLTPLIFTPIGGTLLLTSFGSPRKKILLSMLASAVFWAVVFSTIIHIFGDQVLPEFMRAS